MRESPASSYTAYPVALAAGAALALAAAPREWPALAFFAAPLLLVAIERTSRWPRRAFLVGWLAGTTANAMALYWVVGLLQTFGHFPLVAAIPVAVLLFLAQGLIFALPSYLTAALMARGAPGWIVLPASITVFFSWSPALFAWRPCVPLVTWLPWAQLADVGGEPLLDLLWAVAGCGLFEGWRRSRHRRWPLAAGAFAILIPLSYGFLRIAQIEEDRGRAPSLAVGVIQPNTGILDKHNPMLWPEQLAELQRMTRELEMQGSELTVWPESAYPYPIRRGQRRDSPGSLSVRGDGIEQPVLFGSVTARTRCEKYNSVIALDSDGSIVGVSDKVRLLAFGEYVPLWDYLPPLQKAFPCRGFVPGVTPEVLRVGGARVGVLNCYEDVLAAQARRVAQDDPHFLVNVTNDAWFGDTDEPHLHHQFARLRAIETRRDLVRSVNTGVSGHITATGEELVRTPTFTQVSFLADVRLLSEQTIWTRAGDILTPVLMLSLLGLVQVYRRREASVGSTPN